ncbi:hypothetical protein LAV73_18320 [Lysinibacillus xylanilyticus]|uniref:hypothetical protein n=1 Tax=Lysinibacillus xylanilyticus TaxID=582475 RepID=UPI002B23F11B|nr:hypothetical protein [Lysinibacillus xylanilyticus]MEB2281926.1 hypothetical protein [Lysinibacillus xylanilyticus]
MSYPGQGGKLEILANYKLDKKFFSIDELQTILIGLDALNRIQTENNINHLITKIVEKDERTILKNIDIVIDLSSWFADNSFQDYVIHFRKAIRGQLLMAIKYLSKFGCSKRTVEPYKLLLKIDSLGISGRGTKVKTSNPVITPSWLTSCCCR